MVLYRLHLVLFHDELCHHPGSRHPGIPKKPPFWTYVSIKLFLMKKALSLLDKMLMASTLSSVIMQNWSFLLVLSSFGI